MALEFSYMRFWVLNLLALIISIASLHVKVDSSISFNEEGLDSLSSLPFQEFLPLRNPTNKGSREVELLPRILIKAMSFVFEVRFKITSFIHYLPIYSLNRAREYFLLI